MGCWKYPKGWRYQFQRQKKTYSHGWYKTKAEARAAEQERIKEVEGEIKQTSIHTATGFKEIAYEYLDFCKRRFSEKNYKEKVFIYKTLFNHLGADVDIRTITARDITGYLGTRPTNENWNKHRKSICALFQWAFKNGLVPFNPCVHVEGMPESPKRKTIPSQEEMVKILLASGEYRPFFLCLYALAARLGEINNLRWDDVNFEKREVVLWTKKGRTGEYRKQPKSMNDEVYDELFRLYSKRSGEWVFPNPDTGLPYRNRRAQIRRACLNARVDYYSWHCIRHHVASLLADQPKVKLSTIQKMLGHQLASTTDRYIQTLGTDVIEAADMLKIEKKSENHAQDPCTEKENEG